MATLIPALGTCVARMTSGERRLAERLEQKLEGDYLLWYDVPVGPKQTHPDFVVLHPRRGALILETKDWRLDTIRKATRQYFDIAPDGQPKTVMNPLAQARHCAIKVVNALERAPQIVRGEGCYQGSAEDKKAGVYRWSSSWIATAMASPFVINLTTLQQQAATVAELPYCAHQKGHAWGEMAAICRH